MPKGVTRTIESMRVKDETIITDAEDEEIKGEQNIDEFASYFKGDTTPRLLLTTNRRPKGKIFDFLKEIKSAIPGCEYYERKNFLIKHVIEQAKKEGFTDLLLFYEKNGIPRKYCLLCNYNSQNCHYRPQFRVTLALDSVKGSDIGFVSCILINLCLSKCYYFIRFIDFEPLA